MLKPINIRYENHGFEWAHIYISIEDFKAPEFVYQAWPNSHGVMYVSMPREDGLCKFYSHNPNSEDGYGGAVFELRMEDGSLKQIKGPWSSRASRVQKLTGRRLVSVAINRQMFHLDLAQARELIDRPIINTSLREDEPVWGVSSDGVPRDGRATETWG